MISHITERLRSSPFDSSWEWSIDVICLVEARGRDVCVIYESPGFNRGSARACNQIADWCARWSGFILDGPFLRCCFGRVVNDFVGLAESNTLATWRQFEERLGRLGGSSEKGL